MGMLGSGAVAIWHDIAPEGLSQFYAWHGTEHMPERVAIPGFRRGRRYRAISADLDFFNLYEAETPAVLSSTDYQKRLNDPTPWTSSTVKHFQRVARSICRVAATLGVGQGGLAATWRYDVRPEDAADHIARLSTELFPKFLDEPMIAGAHLLVADTEASAVDTAERKLRGEPNKVPRWVIVLESWGDDGPFMELCRLTLSDNVLTSLGARGPADFGLYRLQATAVPSG